MRILIPKRRLIIVVVLLMVATQIGLVSAVQAHQDYSVSVLSTQKTWLGVFARNIPFETLASLKLEYGVQVTSVMGGSPAQRSGLQEGDIILALDNKPVYSVQRLQWLISNMTNKEKVSLRYYRKGDLNTADVQLSARRPQERFALPWDQWGWSTSSYLGVRLQDMTKDLRTHFGAPAGVGVLITQVTKESPADKAGLSVGDVIVKMDRKNISQIADVYRVLNFFDPGDSIRIEVIRNHESRTIDVSLTANPESAPPDRYYGWRRSPYFVPPPFFDPRFWQEHLMQPLQRWNDILEELQRYYRKGTPDSL